MMLKVCPVTIPSHLNISRNLKENLRHIDKKPLDEFDLLEYDNKTIFYDVFFNPDNTILYALGPPLLNLEDELSPISISINSKNVKFKLVNIGDGLLSLLHIVLDNEGLKSLVKEENYILINFGNKWIWEKNISKNRCQDLTTLTLSTLQKNNQIKWIKDWIIYYKEVFGVQRVILYDNNSDYQSILTQEIDIPNVDIIPWNFLYGPTRSLSNCFCQLGSLNHCRLKYSNSQFCLNFDIDEILVVKNKENLFKYLNKYSVVYFDSFNVPFIDPKQKDFSFANFTLREQELRSRKGYKPDKYIYNFSKVYINMPHKAITHKYEPRLKIFDNKYLKKIHKLFFILKTILISVINIDIQFSDSYKFNVKDAYFLHFLSITTNWKLIYWDRLKEREKTDSLVEDNSVADFFNSKPKL
ncbi:glycosyltransferase family 92 protein [Calothrix sp. FACHB-156]|nr:glycosyltransferase family 92 protein [Calothrix sp. FACHB-156]